MSDHTRKERDLINGAYNTLEALARDCDRVPDLKRAFSYERKGRSALYARLVLIDSAAAPVSKVSGLFGVSTGCAWAMTFGAWLRSKEGRERRPEVAKRYRAWLKEAAAAREAGRAASRRRSRKINDRFPVKPNGYRA